MSNRTIEVGSDYERLLSALPKERVPHYLCEQVTDRIRQERAKSTRARLVGASLFGITSAASGAYVAVQGITAASHSGFFSYLGLAGSDSGLVFRDIGAFGLSLLESFPGVQAIAFFALLAILIGSLRVFGQALKLRPALRASSLTIA